MMKDDDLKLLRVLITDRLMDICECRIAFTTEKHKRRKESSGPEVTRPDVMELICIFSGTWDKRLKFFCSTLAFIKWQPGESSC